jgi:hypothetical protein
MDTKTVAAFISLLHDQRDGQEQGTPWQNPDAVTPEHTNARM